MPQNKAWTLASYPAGWVTEANFKLLHTGGVTKGEPPPDGGAVSYNGDRRLHVRVIVRNTAVANPAIPPPMMITDGVASVSINGCSRVRVSVCESVMNGLDPQEEGLPRRSHVVAAIQSLSAFETETFSERTRSGFLDTFSNKRRYTPAMISAAKTLGRSSWGST